MPSLSALGQFKASFDNIANEKADVESLHLPFYDLPLPENEAPPFDYSRYAQEDQSGNIQADLPSDDHDDLIEKPEPLGGSSPLENFDLNSFLNDGGGGTNLPDVPKIDIDEPALDDSSDPFSADDDDSSFLDSLLKDSVPDESPPASAPVKTDVPAQENASDFSVPDDLLSGFSDDMETAALDFPADDFKPDDSGGAQEDIDFNLDKNSIDLGGESLGETGSFENEPLETPAGDDDFSLDDFNMDDDSFVPKEESQSSSPELPADDFDLGAGSEGIDLGGETLDADQESVSGSNDDFDFSDDSSFPDFDAGLNANFDGQDTGSSSLPSDADFDAFNTEDSGAPLDDSMFDTGGFDSSDFGAGDSSDTSVSGEDSGALPDFGDLGSDFASGSIDLDTELSADMDTSSHDDVFGNDDFAFDGLDDILGKSKVAPLPSAAPQKKGLFGRKKDNAAEAAEPEAEENIEEISLSQEHVNSLLQTLNKYPLNLRIICEELIAEQVILPAQLAKLIRLLINGVHVKETAALVQEITGKPVVIPKSFEKMTGAAFEAEQSSFAYIFVHNFIPVFRLFAFIAIIATSVLYLGYRFVFIPLRAESLYKRGYERIPEAEYQRANELFSQAFAMHPKKKWFYSYAEAFRDMRRYPLAEEKYSELLTHYPLDKKGVLDYANLNTYYIMNYEKANNLLQRWLLDFSPDDFEGLLAAGDNFMIWADSNPSRFYEKYEDARFAYARLLDKYGWQQTIVERMMMYFIRTDNLREVLSLRLWFESNPKRQLSAESLAELGGYLLDKQLETPAGVPNPYVESIESVRAMLLQAVRMNNLLPEPHYHLARYYNSLGNTYEERLTLENAVRAYNLTTQETVRRRLDRVDTHFRYANLLINNREFFPAEENVVRAINLYEDFVSRNLITPTSQLGELYSLNGDLEYFVKSGDMETALKNYHTAERYGYSPPEVQYRMGAAYYMLEDWRNSLEYLFKASAGLPLNRRLLYALGNAAYQRGDYFAAQGYYNRLLGVLESQRIMLPVLLPNDSQRFLETGERIMMARNNAGVVNEILADQTGNINYRSAAMVHYLESSSAWDAITRDPELMTRMRLIDSPGAPSINLGYVNANNALRPNVGYRPQVFVRIDKDALEPSKWEELLSR